MGFDFFNRFTRRIEDKVAEIPDLNSGEFYDNFYQYYPRLLNEGVHYFPKSMYYGVFGYHAAKQLLKDVETFRSTRLQVTDRILVGADKEVHSTNKKLIYSSLTFLHRNREEQDLQFVDQLLDKIFSEALGHKGNINPVKWLVYPFVFAYLTRSLGLKSQVGYDILSNSSQSYADKIERINDLYGNLQLIDGIASESVATGKISTQLSSVLEKIHETGSFSIDDSVRFVRLLILAGLDTTSSLLGSCLLLYKTEELSIEPGSVDLKNFISETLRYYSPAQFTFRTTVKEVVLGEYSVPLGSVVGISIGAANRDPTVFKDPQIFKLNRMEADHLAFGVGRHQCIGENLALYLAECFMSKYLRYQDRIVLTDHRYVTRNSVFSFGISELNAVVKV